MHKHKWKTWELHWIITDVAAIVVAATDAVWKGQIVSYSSKIISGESLNVFDKMATRRLLSMIWIADVQ